MLPFIHIGPVEIASYGTMIAIGILFGMLLIRLRPRKCGLPLQDAFYAFIFGMLGVAVGAKLMYIIQALPRLIPHFSELIQDPMQLLMLLTSGFVFYGGLIGGLAGGFLYSKVYHLSFRVVLETLIPVVPLVHGFGRIGCFLAGCCYGIPYDGPGHVVFGSAGFAPPNIPLFPVQLVESALLFLLLAFLLLYDKYAKRPRSIVGWYLLIYGLIRMVTELFRGDEIRGSFLFFSTSQWISVVLIALGVFVLIKYKGLPVFVPGPPGMVYNPPGMGMVDGLPEVAIVDGSPGIAMVDGSAGTVLVDGPPETVDGPCDMADNPPDSEVADNVSEIAETANGAHETVDGTPGKASETS